MYLIMRFKESGQNPSLLFKIINIILSLSFLSLRFLRYALMDLNILI